MGKAPARRAPSNTAGAGDKLKTANFVKARHILCAKQSKILEVHQRLREQYLDDGQAVPPAAFGTLAQQYSECPSGKRGGELGWFDRQKMEPKFRDVAFSTAPGSVSEPFKGANGWHIVLIEGRRN
ncbi:hypothetical protein CDCA_CDCA04G1263 [Cyanidium caldarium]|uniref:Peptidyl-prolyl cis-trans isomerase n=1 Tax=Cyanidium caldarium TaxID=2771 RepID=A0AAV9IT26_CYACA|nr:hypothetical protein CDCA_CDCA04G1263 [Cyanidium caldarium]